VNKNTPGSSNPHDRGSTRPRRRSSSSHVGLLFLLQPYHMSSFFSTGLLLLRTRLLFLPSGTACLSPCITTPKLLCPHVPLHPTTPNITNSATTATTGRTIGRQRSSAPTVASHCPPDHHALPSPLTATTPRWR
jgi:hypothetical protein